MRVEDVAKVFPLDVSFMPVPRCEHCQHWERHDSFSPMGECQQIQLNDNGPINAAALMPVEACLTVRSDFGCVLFTGKPVADKCQESPNGEHQWQDVTTYDETTRRYVCTECSKIKTDPAP